MMFDSIRRRRRHTDEPLSRTRTIEEGEDRDALREEEEEKKKKEGGVMVWASLTTPIRGSLGIGWCGVGTIEHAFIKRSRRHQKIAHVAISQFIGQRTIHI